MSFLCTFWLTCVSRLCTIKTGQTRQTNKGWCMKHKYEHPLYSTWSGMMQRCHNKDGADYSNWGGKGITVCARWHNFDNFAADLVNKPTKKHQLDRIDNNKGYSPDNCRWVTPKENMRNTSRVRKVTFDGVTHCVSEWAEIWGISPSMAHYRINAGWSPDKIASTPSKSRKPNLGFY